LLRETWSVWTAFVAGTRLHAKISRNKEPRSRCWRFSNEQIARESLAAGPNSNFSQGCCRYPMMRLSRGWPTPNCSKQGDARPPRADAVVDGDALSASIAAESMVAKITRHALMRECARFYPTHGFESHKGYGTMAHLDALRRFGPTPLHRRSFEPVSVTGRAQLDLAFAARQG
jgi:hypothetical protein